MNDELRRILSSMEIPSNRREDIRWLLRNLGVRNSGHPEFWRAIELLKTAARNP